MELLRLPRQLHAPIGCTGLIVLCLLMVWLPGSYARTPTQSTIIHRENLRTVVYNDPSTTTRTRPEVHAALQSEVAFVQNLKTSAVLYEKNSDKVQPIASISKLMTALLIVESGLHMNQELEITDADVDRMRHSRSRLRVGTRLTRTTMLHLALMASENRAAHALARTWPGGKVAFVRAMNDKARALGMRHTQFVEPTGLSSENVSSPRDLVKLLKATSRQPLIHRYTTDATQTIDIGRGKKLTYQNTNRLVKRDDWNIQISKTGFINEAGECLVMLVRIGEQDLAIILLDSAGRYSRIGDAVRLRALVENNPTLAMM